MSRRSVAAARRTDPVFAVPGDITRLELISRLGRGQQHAIAQQSEGHDITRQGVAAEKRAI